MFGIQWDMTQLPPLPGANILIDAAGNAKLADFGACMQLEARQDGHGIFDDTEEICMLCSYGEVHDMNDLNDMNDMNGFLSGNT